MKTPDILRFRAFFDHDKLVQFGLQKAKHIGAKAIYQILLCYFTYKQKDTPAFVKQTLMGVIGYVLSPIDVVPDLTPVLGYTDDIGVLAYALVALSSYINAESHLEASKLMRSWNINFQHTNTDNFPH